MALISPHTAITFRDAPVGDYYVRSDGVRMYKQTNGTAASKVAESIELGTVADLGTAGSELKAASVQMLENVLAEQDFDREMLRTQHSYINDTNLPVAKRNEYIYITTTGNSTGDLLGVTGLALKAGDRLVGNVDGTEDKTPGDWRLESAGVSSGTQILTVANKAAAVAVAGEQVIYRVQSNGVEYLHDGTTLIVKDPDAVFSNAAAIAAADALGEWELGQSVKNVETNDIFDYYDSGAGPAMHLRIGGTFQPERKYPVVSDMLAAAGVADGEKVETRGYLSLGVGANEYYYDATDTTTVINGGTVLPGAGGVMSRDAAGVFDGDPGDGRYKAREMTVADVTLWGAVPDRTVDCSPAFNAAMTWAAANKASVWVPYGDGYNLNTTVEILAPLKGETSKDALVEIDGRMTDGTPAFYHEGGGLQLQNLHIQKNFTVGACLQLGDAVAVKSSTRGSIENVFFRGNLFSTVGLDAQRVWNMSFSNCFFGLSDIGLKITMGNALSFFGCTIETNVTGMAIEAGSGIGFFGGSFQGNTAINADLTGSLTEVLRGVTFYDHYFEGTSITHMRIGEIGDVGNIRLVGGTYHQPAGPITDSPLIELKRCDGFFVDKSVALRCRLDIGDACKNVEVETAPSFGFSLSKLLTHSENARFTGPLENHFANPYGKGGWRGFHGTNTLSSCTVAESSQHRGAGSSMELTCTANANVVFARTTLPQSLVESWRGQTVYTGAWTFVPNGQTATIWPAILLELSVDAVQTFSEQPGNRNYIQGKWVWSAFSFDVPIAGVFTTPRLRVAASWINAMAAGDRVLFSDLFLTTSTDFLRLKNRIPPSPDSHRWERDRLVVYADAAPVDAVSNWEVGDEVIQPDGTSVKCTVAGAPGTWA